MAAAPPKSSAVLSTNALGSDLESMLPLTLLRVREAFMVRIRPLLADAGITEAQWRTLRVLYRHNKLDFGELADAAFVQRASLTRIIKQLADRSSVTRTINQQDQRQVDIELTAMGRELVDSLLPVIEATYEKIADQVGDPHLMGLRNALTDFIESLDG
ncbi:MarR family transcriptional regulator [Brevibacterium luteolum]|uniref:MarR family transcriptional regulator n=1 Tax=Brevibacterium luteolum TaxID=199591 RepID=UPI00223BB0BB|nr:MarR family transcriptional regulator [Brevibacterium luteolum]MCT1829757.1 MarR family transcriptional regulator [Brevibacterium luteolum]